MKHWKLVFLIFLIPVASVAQGYHFVNYSVRDGLSQSQVLAIDQDSSGYLWIATVGGLSRFNGVVFENYNRTHGLVNNEVSKVLCFENKIVVASKGGVSFWEYGRFRPLPFADSLAQSFVFDLAYDQDGSLLVATNGAGLLRIKDDKISRTDLGSSDANFIRRILRIGSETYLGTKDGLIILTKTGQRKVVSGISVSDVKYWKGAIYVASFNKGILKADYENGKVDTLVNIISTEQSSSYIREVIPTDDGVYFINRLGLQKLHNGAVQALKPVSQDFETNLRTLFLDQEQNIWLGTDGLGLFKFTGESFQTFTTADGLTSDIIMTINEHKGDIWLGSYGKGVNRLENRTFSALSTAEGLSNNTVWCSLVDARGTIWFGTAFGLSNFDENTFTNLYEKDGLPFARVTSLFEENPDKIWIGTSAGIAWFSQGNLVEQLPENLQEIKEIKGFRKSAGSMWIASGSGLFRYDLKTKATENVTEQLGLKDLGVFSIETDQRDMMWLGTEAGVMRMNLINFSLDTLVISQNFSSNVANFLLLDHKDWLWVGTDNGLFKLRGKADSLEVESFNAHDGVTALEFNQNAVFEDSQNRLWFGTNNGLLCFEYPEKSATNSENPILNIVIEDVLSNFESVGLNDYSPNEMPEFESKRNRLTFTFGAIHFSNPEKVFYSYRLGKDEDWSKPSRERSVTYAGLNPGTYSFEVRAKVENGTWSATSEAFEFEIQAPFWLQWWFISLVALGLLGVLAIIYKQRLWRRERKAQMVSLENKAKILGLEQQTLNAHMNRHFIFNALNSIQYYINSEDRKSANSYLTSFAALVRKNLDSAQVEHISLQEELDRLKLYLKLEEMRFSGKFHHEIHVAPEIDTNTTQVPSMILQPFVENSIMHGILPKEKHGVVKVFISQKADSIQISVEDNGIGYTRSLSQKNKIGGNHVSNGMKITKQRVALMRELTGLNYAIDGPEDLLQNGESVGTTVRILLPSSRILIEDDQRA